jgi:drug/metabolite transporter (DMT)-like permease
MLLGSFIWAQLASFLYACTNQIDKRILEKHLDKYGPGTLILYSTLLTSIVLVVLIISSPITGLEFWSDFSAIVNLPEALAQYMFNAQPLSDEDINVSILVIVAVLNVLVLGCYLYAMAREEAVVVIIFYQLVPVFTGIGGWFVLGEAISSLQLAAMILILLGTGYVSFREDDDGNRIISWGTISLMVPASIFWAAETVLFKKVALEESLVRSIFFEGVIMVMLGFLILVFIPQYRRAFWESRKLGGKLLSLNVLNESLYNVANVAIGYAALISTAAFVMTTNTYQAFYVLVLSMLIAKRIIYTRKELVQFSIALVLTGVGAYILVDTGIEF